MSKDFKADIILTVREIKAGNKLLREEFISDYKPFIIKTVSNVTGRFIDTENSDEFSIGLSAFNEAIDSYNESKNMMFLNFSALVIKRRITDYIRRNSKHNIVYPFTYFEDKENNYFEQTHLRTDIDMQSNYEVSKETELFEKRLNDFGIGLNDLVREAPKHKDSKYLCIKIAKIIAENKPLFDKLERTGNIPKTELLKNIKINKKTIERNRVFIIAAALILGNGFYSLRDFVDISEIEEGQY
ncbi:MAG: RNA polymerase sigma-I factor [Clostridiaceae bacterium]|nr:RNA polymerase sigma-I factor [Clostridiaceae bacterium]